jgi:hypothetical protein
VSEALVAFAPWIAARNEPVPELFVFVTVKVAASARPTSASPVKARVQTRVDQRLMSSGGL